VAPQRAAVVAALAERGCASRGLPESAPMPSGDCKRRGRVPVVEPTRTWSVKQGVDLPCVRPILRFYNEACAHRIFQHIPPLPFVAFGGAQQMIEKLPLPKRRVQSSGAKNALCRPLFKSSNEPRQTDGLGGSALATEEMQMIRHHDITTYCPTIAFGRSFKFLAQDGEGVPIRENPPPTLCAARDEIDRGIDPNRVEAT
jgi:hypothetical protein